MPLWLQSHGGRLDAWVDFRAGSRVGLTLASCPEGPSQEWQGKVDIRFVRDAIKGAKGELRVSVNPASPMFYIERQDGERHLIMGMADW